MRHLVHTRRLLCVTLLFIAALMTLAGAPQASAETRNPTPGDMEAVCLAEGGLYYEDYENGVLVGYGCMFPEGDKWHCNASGTMCFYIQHYPTERASDASQPAGSENQNSYPPVQSAPADSYQTGYEYQSSGQ